MSTAVDYSELAARALTAMSVPFVRVEHAWNTQDGLISPGQDEVSRSPLADSQTRGGVAG